MRLTRETGDKKKKPAKEHKKHRDHVANYMKDELQQSASIADLFHKK